MASKTNVNVDDQQRSSGVVEHHDDFVQRRQFGNNDEQESSGAEISRFSGFANDRSTGGAESYVRRAFPFENSSLFDLCSCSVRRLGGERHGLGSTCADAAEEEERPLE